MNLALGIVLALCAGTLNGLFPLPMKAVKRWEWESIWLPFTILSLVIFPLVIAWTIAPHFGTVVLQARGIDIAQALLCGIVAYTGSLMFGLAVPRIGAGLSFALLVGAMNAVGILVPRLLARRTLASTSGDRLVLCGVILSIVSVAIGFWVGKVKTTATHDSGNTTGALGAMLAIAGGALSGLLPIGMSMPFAARLASSAFSLGGADPARATTIALTFVLLGGAIPNCAYCAHLQVSRKTYRNYVDRRLALNWLLVLCMGVFYSSSNALWGVAISPYYLGELGPSIGWALFVGMIVASSTCMGLISGEWKGASRSSHIMLGVSIVLLITGMVAICAGTYRL